MKTNLESDTRHENQTCETTNAMETNLEGDTRHENKLVR